MQYSPIFWLQYPDSVTGIIAGQFCSITFNHKRLAGISRQPFFLIVLSHA
ncbi:hypothetical protein L21SP2_1136 [Salinispira pacifica]|uniref:Uncharacterized protein n=1 Tax=Salinispira pacifica TaxID=1307761 RepID=V5WG75_9SPIO|nr:hypothetical protein L21SP2_1136 [Salinispira pacifica]